jgi:hypothetical protein
VDQEGGPGFTAAHCNYAVNINNFIQNTNGLTIGDATATVGFRSVGVKATAETDLQTNLPENFGAAVSASAALDDVFIMDASFPNGTPVPSGFLQVNLVTTGFVNLDIVGSGQLSEAHLNYTLLVGGSSVAVNSIDFMFFDGSQSVTAILNGVIPWTAGVAIPIHMEASASVDANLTFSGSVDASADFGNSLDWIGITNVTDESGNPVASFSALSPEGLDWGVVVPIPAAVWLFGSGLLGLVGIARRKKAA